MQKGIYIALSGAVLKQQQMDTIAQNLANADTTGYKKDGMSFQDYLMPQDMISPDPDGRVMTALSSFNTNFSQGNFVKTDNPLHLAVDGSGMIALEGNRYTRRGDFVKDSKGYLTTSTGVKVLGQKGPIRLPEGMVSVGGSGQISVDGTLVDTIRVKDFPQTDSLTKAGESAFTATQSGVPSKSVLKQGYLEKSNVDAIQEMVSMIETSREFEAYQKVIQTFDQAASKVNNDIGRL
jgi:flagellar basal-body rod protein FlgF